MNTWYAYVSTLICFKWQILLGFYLAKSGYYFWFVHSKCAALSLKPHHIFHNFSHLSFATSPYSLLQVKYDDGEIHWENVDSDVQMCVSSTGNFFCLFLFLCSLSLLVSVLIFHSEIFYFNPPFSSFHPHALSQTLSLSLSLWSLSHAFPLSLLTPLHECLFIFVGTLLVKQNPKSSPAFGVNKWPLWSISAFSPHSALC